MGAQGAGVVNVGHHVTAEQHGGEHAEEQQHAVRPDPHHQAPPDRRAEQPGEAAREAHGSPSRDIR
jgi:hypothetical protein